MATRLRGTRFPGNEDAVGGGAPPAAGPVTSKLAEATLKRLKKATGVENLTTSGAVTMRDAEPQQTRAVTLARMLLLHLGAEEEEATATSERWGAAFWQRAQELEGDKAKISWQTICDWAELTVLVVAATKNTTVPANGAVEKTSFFVGRGAGDNYYVGLHPRRESDIALRRLIDDEVSSMAAAASAKKRRNDVIDVPEDDESTTRAEPKRGRREAETTERDFEIAEEHPVLDEWSDFDSWRRAMRRVRTTKALIWSEFIGIDIIDKFNVYYTALYRKEFQETRLTLKEFVERAGEVRDSVKNEETSFNGCEPRLFPEPEGVPTFVKEYLWFLKTEEGKKN
jgi:hypothetical protein